VAKPPYIELGSGERIPILFEDRSVIAIDKPAGWMLVPVTWQDTLRNLQAAIASSLAEGRFWARSRNLKFLRYVHRLDADTSGVLLLAKSQGALESLGRLFESRQVHKTYLAVVRGVPVQNQWECHLALAPTTGPAEPVLVDEKGGKECETHFRVLAKRLDPAHGEITLVEAKPITGRTHQIRVHLAAAGYPVLADPMYGRPATKQPPAPPPPVPRSPQRPPPARRPARAPDAAPLALRSIMLAYRNPFDRRMVTIHAPVDEFLRRYGFASYVEKQPDSPKTNASPPPAPPV